MIAGTILHIVIGLIIYRITRWTPLAISMLFLFKEIGEAKYHLPGSIWSIDKTLRTFGLLCEPQIAIQWIAPGFFVYGMILLEKRFGRSRRSPEQDD